MTDNALDTGEGNVLDSLPNAQIIDPATNEDVGASWTYGFHSQLIRTTHYGTHLSTETDAIDFDRTIPVLEMQRKGGSVEVSGWMRVSGPMGFPETVVSYEDDNNFTKWVSSGTRTSTMSYCIRLTWDEAMMGGARVPLGIGSAISHTTISAAISNAKMTGYVKIHDVDGAEAMTSIPSCDADFEVSEPHTPPSDLIEWWYSRCWDDAEGSDLGPLYREPFDNVIERRYNIDFWPTTCIWGEPGRELGADTILGGIGVPEDATVVDLSIHENPSGPPLDCWTAATGTIEDVTSYHFFCSSELDESGDYTYPLHGPRDGRVDPRAADCGA